MDIFQFAAGALDHRPDEGKQFGIDLGLDPIEAMGPGRRCWLEKRELDDESI